jgi:hypothetical protein
MNAAETPVPAGLVTAARASRRCTNSATPLESYDYTTRHLAAATGVAPRSVEDAVAIQGSENEGPQAVVDSVCCRSEG